MLKRLSLKTYSAIACLFFILWLPKDWEDRGDAFGAWRRILPEINQNQALWIFSLVLLTWLVWNDIRQWRTKHKNKKLWWGGLQSFTIRDFASVVAGVPPQSFDESDRAKAVAAEIRGYVNSGHMPLMLEAREPNLRLQDYGGPKYVTKNVADNATVLRSDLEKLAIARKWKLPWEPQLRKTPVPVPVKNALSR